MIESKKITFSQYYSMSECYPESYRDRIKQIENECTPLAVSIADVTAVYTTETQTLNISFPAIAYIMHDTVLWGHLDISKDDIIIDRDEYVEDLTDIDPALANQIVKEIDCWSKSDYVNFVTVRNLEPHIDND